MKLNINTSIQNLLKTKLISEKCYQFLKKNNINDTFDIMTTKLPENLDDEIDEEIEEITDFLYKTI